MTSATKNMSSAMLRRIEQRTYVAANGAAQLLALRDALHHAIDTIGIRVEFSPDSDPALVDYVGLAALGAVGTGLGGAAVGTLVGSLWEEPLVGMVVGGVLGALIGAASGASAVDRGWRLHLTWLPSGEPLGLLVPDQQR